MKNFQFLQPPVNHLDSLIYKQELNLELGTSQPIDILRSNILLELGFSFHFSIQPNLELAPWNLNILQSCD